MYRDTVGNVEKKITAIKSALARDAWVNDPTPAKFGKFGDPHVSCQDMSDCPAMNNSLDQFPFDDVDSVFDDIAYDIAMSDMKNSFLFSIAS
jgi:hypothetical protein